MVHIAQATLLIRRIWRRFRMYLLRPMFRRYGARFVFDPDGIYSYDTIEVGNDVRLGLGATLIASESQIIIGSHVLFGPNVAVIGGDHNTSVVGKFMWDVKTKRPQDDQCVMIEDDVWVGTGAIILNGVRLGRGCVVAAGAVVTEDVPPYTIAGGVPARVLKVRFDPETILQHEAQLYTPEQRLSRNDLYAILEPYL